MGICIDRIVISENDEGSRATVEVIRPHGPTQWVGHNGQFWTFSQLCQRIVRWSELGYDIEVVTL